VNVRAAITNRPRDTAKRKSCTRVTILTGMKERLATNYLILSIIGTAPEFLKFSLRTQCSGGRHFVRSSVMTCGGY
jgi:hypothetical protein